MFAPRGQAANSRLRAFSPLVPPTLGSVTLAYVREVDLLSQRRKDAVQPSRAAAETDEAGGDEAKPKRQRFPRRPKAP